MSPLSAHAMPTVEYWHLQYSLSADIPHLQAFLIIKEPVGFVGNRTECALLMMLRGWGLDYKAIRDEHASSVQKVWDFDSAKKMASVMTKTPTGFRLFNKVSLCQVSCRSCDLACWTLSSTVV